LRTFSSGLAGFTKQPLYTPMRLLATGEKSYTNLFFKSFHSDRALNAIGQDTFRRYTARYENQIWLVLGGAGLV
jgi:hypothetical protein